MAQKEAKRLLERWEEAVDAGDKQYARELLRNLMKKNREATELAKASFDLLEQAYDEKYSEGALCC